MRPSPANLACRWTALLACSTAAAQNDECTGALPLALGSTAFDTSAATTSAPPWLCATGGNDLWYSFTAPNAATYAFNTCTGTSYDSTLEIFSGPCGALDPLYCNDGACGTRSGVWVPANAGDTFLLRVGGRAGATGTGNLEVVENFFPAPPPGPCLMTLFHSDNQGAVGGAVYFAMTTTAAIEIHALQTNFGAAWGTPVGMDAYMAPAGTTPTGSGWVQVGTDDGSAISAGTDNPTSLFLAAPIPVAAGSYEVALVAVGSQHRYTTNAPTSPHFSDGTLTITVGQASNVPFTPPVFEPRTWNGALCYAGDLGVLDAACAPLPHSLGGTVALNLTGSGVAGSFLLATASGGIPGEFGYFISGPNPGLYVIPPGSSGVLCIESPQFRYSSVPGYQVFRFDASGVSRTVVGGGSSFLPTNGSYAPVPAVMVGESRAFQAWFRDGGGFGSGFSESKVVLFM